MNYIRADFEFDRLLGQPYFSQEGYYEFAFVVFRYLIFLQDLVLSSNIDISLMQFRIAMLCVWLVKYW